NPLVPFHDLQVQHTDRIEDRHQQQRDERGCGKSADLRVTQGLPERAAMQGKRDQPEHRRAHRNHYRPQTHDSGIQYRRLERLAFGMLLLDEVEENDDMTHYHAYQADHAQEGHESERHAHDPERGHRAYRAERNRSEHDERLDGVLELER